MVMYSLTRRYYASILLTNKEYVVEFLFIYLQLPPEVWTLEWWSVWRFLSGCSNGWFTWWSSLASYFWG